MAKRGCFFRRRAIDDHFSPDIDSPATLSRDLSRNQRTLGSLIVINMPPSRRSVERFRQPAKHLLEELRRDDPVLRRRVERLLEVELSRATTIIQARRPEVEDIARAIANRGVVWGREVMDIVSKPKGDGVG
ncbi:hypothetical protein CFBP5507_15965 [Agrobacterium salinitolerans]|uniref:Uncharacterized protein n=1 Tax=Agrobacterium salinitolerans TaxID=1183413 RepID=A0A9X9KCZ1_9HYPH|nr:hypothetical protein [Agrobacterium salinitolerans]UYZ09212.1 hypothetical protein CFBP5507_15965 [Agrobacterium salinitolerans]